MAHRFTTFVRKANIILNNGPFSGNCKIFAQPKRFELGQFLSQLSAHPPLNPLKGFDKPSGPKEGNKRAAFLVGGIGAYRMSSSFSGGGDEDRSDEIEKESVQANLAQLVNVANSTDPQIQYDAVTSVRKLLCSDGNPPIDPFIDSNILPTLVNCLRSQNRALLIEAAWVLIIISSGTSEQIHAVVQAGAVPHLLKLLTSPHKAVCEGAVWVLGNVIGDGPELRDHVISQGVVAPLLNCIQPDTPISLLRKVTLSIKNLCGHEDAPPPPETLREILPALNVLVKHSDTRVLVDTVRALRDLTDSGNEQVQMVLASGVVPKLVELLNRCEVEIQAAAVRAVGNIVTGTMESIPAGLNCDALSYFENLLDHPYEKICSDTLMMLSKITAGNCTQVQAVIDAGFVPRIIYHLEKGVFPAKKAAAWAVHFMTCSGNKEQVAYLIDCGVIPPFCNLLKCKDSEAILVTLLGIHIILKKSVNKNGENYVGTLIEDCGGLKKIQSLKNHKSIAISDIAKDIIDHNFSNDEEEHAELAPEAAAKGDQLDPNAAMPRK